MLRAAPSPLHRLPSADGGAALLLATLLAGCAVLGPAADPHRNNLARDDDVGHCARLYRGVDRAVSRAGAGDAQTARITGFPYLRINRFLADSPPPAESTEAFAAWVDALRALDREARRMELANLPPARAAAGGVPELERCAALLRRHDLADTSMRTRLTRTRVGDAYSWSRRALGLYPLTSLAFLNGVADLHRETRATFATATAHLPVRGSLTRFSPQTSAPPLSRAQVAGLLAASSANPLQIPQPDEHSLAQLFETFAPVWDIDVAVPADRPGSPRVVPRGPPEVAGTARVYTHASHSYWQGRVLLQLNYVIWFPGRPRSGPLDLLGGHLDGITWRVTLDERGVPLLYDAMHNCGCYHMAFPTPRLTTARQRHAWQEPLLVLPAIADGDGRLVVRVASISHYLQNVGHSGRTPPPPGQARAAYRLAVYADLRSLPLADGGRRSLFRPDGIIEGSQRRERWLFWPMGVVEPGAMRQWGHHAVAFVGRRHFDDPRLLDRYFVPAQQSDAGALSRARFRRPERSPDRDSD